jgi:deoxyribodipyrimidine photo-lyase
VPSLQHAIYLADQQSLPLVVIESLEIGHKFANDRLHTFVIQGMLDNIKSFEDSSSNIKELITK